MLNLDKINIGYGKIGVLWDVSLKVNENEVVALVGKLGHGKTYLLNKLTGTTSKLWIYLILDTLLIVLQMCAKTLDFCIINN